MESMVWGMNWFKYVLLLFFFLFYKVIICSSGFGFIGDLKYVAVGRDYHVL